MSVAIFFIGITAIISSILPAGHRFMGIFGGPNAKAVGSKEGKNELALLYKMPNPAGNMVKNNQKNEYLGTEYILSDSTDGPNLNPSTGGYVDYKVAKGDTLSGIAKSFGISIETISAANPKTRGGSIKEGEVLKILPVTGFVYLLKDGEAVETVASKFGLSIFQLSGFNSGVELSSIKPGSPVVIPGNPRSAEGSQLPDLKTYFALPAEGLNWGSLHNYNAVDIANICGTKVVSSADGLVTEIGIPEENNGGYGGYVLIEHPNGTRTRYAHLGKIDINLGDYVKKGIKIGEMGNSGTVHGPSGCHLHFEVYEAQNPFRKI